MRLLIASLAASLGCAQNIDQLVGQLLEQIYHVDDEGYQIINLAPYYTGKIMMGDDHFTTDFTFSNGRSSDVCVGSEKASWSDTGLEYEYTASGNAKNTWWADIYDQNYVDTDYSKKTVIKVDLEAFDIQVHESGDVNGVTIKSNHQLKLTGMAQTQSKMTVGLNYNLDCNVPAEIDDYWRQMLCQTGDADINMEVAVKHACMSDPLDQSCNVKVTVTGEWYDADIGTNTAKYYVTSDKVQIKFKENDVESFYVCLCGIKKLDVFKLKYRFGADEDLVLAFQIVGPAKHQDVVNAAMVFATPFIRLFSAIKDCNDFMHLVAYFDTVFQNVAENTYFDFSPVFAATQIESEMLAESWGISSLQESVEFWGQETNAAVADFALMGEIKVKEGREYVQKLVGEEGKSNFDAWWSTV